MRMDVHSLQSELSVQININDAEMFDQKKLLRMKESKQDLEVK